MNKVLLRFYIKKTHEVIEAYFDGRLSFKENFELLGYENGLNIYDPNKGIFLDTNKPLSTFNICRFMAFDVY